ncbi:MAG: hypothetical protein DCC71_24255 [Proteobacteria bacterium]|nr:MAG: hypothetical protein DCC71_24255 [Pseudomonadota bacterium]
MPVRIPILWSALAVASLPSGSAPRTAHAQLGADGTTGFANAYGTNDPADVTTTPGPDGLDVSIGAAATKSAGLLAFPWLEDFESQAIVLGTSLSAGVPELVRLVLGSQHTTATSDTQVGHTLRLRGQLLASGEIHAGHRACCAFTTEAVASTSATSAGLWIVTPAGVDLVAASGADYTQPVPEPGGGLAGAAAAASLAGCARAHRRRSSQREEHTR